MTPEKLCKDQIAKFKKLADKRYKKLHDYYIDKPHCEVDLKQYRELEDMTVKEQSEPYELCLSLIKENKKHKRLLRRWKKTLEPFPIVSDLKALETFMAESRDGTPQDAEAIHKLQKKHEKVNRKLYEDTDEALNNK